MVRQFRLRLTNWSARREVHERGPFVDAMAANIARLKDCASGGMTCAVDPKNLGIKKATSVEATRPSAPVRRKTQQCLQNKRSCCACHSRESLTGVSISKTTPSTFCNVVSGCCLVAVCVTSPFPPEFDLPFPRLRPENKLHGSRYISLSTRRYDRIEPTFILEGAGNA